MSEAKASVSERRRIPGIWLVPIVALLLGLWMVIYTWANQGPERPRAHRSGSTFGTNGAVFPRIPALVHESSA